MNKQAKRRFSLSRKRQNMLIGLISFVMFSVALCLLFFSYLSTANFEANTRKLLQMTAERQAAVMAIEEFRDASTEMTTAVWQFIATKNVLYMHNYLKELNVNRRRDAAVAQLMKSALSEQERERVLQAKLESDALVNGEKWAIRLTCDSLYLSLDRMPPDIAAVRLSPWESRWTPEEKGESASRYAFGQIYTRSRQRIMTNIDDFRRDIELRETQRTVAALQDTTSQFKKNFAIMIAFITLLAVLIIYAMFVNHINSQRDEQVLTIKKTQNELKSALSIARAASEAKGDFLSRMSHEMRTPLNAVIGFIAVADDSGDQSVVRDCVKKALTASRQLLSVINDVLDISSIENGKLKIAADPFNFSELISSVTQMFSQSAAQKQLNFDVQLQDVTENRLVGDSVRLRQILSNLISNAIKFTPEGGSVTLRVAQLRCDEKNAYMRFTVADTGIGMTPEYMKRLFQPFEQQDAGIRRQFGGTGLGLSITHTLVKMLHGSITAVSLQGAGSTFTVELPLPLDLSAAQPEAPGRAAPRQTDFDFTGKRILLAEDHPVNREVAKAMLKKTHVGIDIAENGEQALKLFETSAPGSYDAILMDIVMPVMDGYEAARRIRSSAHPQSASIPIIAMTANVFSEDITRARAAGMNDHLGKPVEMEVLYGTLARWIAGGPAERS